MVCQCSFVVYCIFKMLVCVIVSMRVSRGTCDLSLQSTASSSYYRGLADFLFPPMICL